MLKIFIFYFLSCFLKFLLICCQLTQLISNSNQQLFTRNEKSIEVRLLDEEELITTTKTLIKSSNLMPIGLNEQLLSIEGRESLRQQLMFGEDDKELDEILSKIEIIAKNGGVKPLPSGVLEPMLNKSGYDPRSSPQFVQGRPVEVRVGILVQSIANFQLSTMDYDMDCWLRMSWRDPRLALNLSTPILINDEIFLKKIWRPDIHFVNARNSLFHRVTRLNFYIFIFPMSGKVFFEARLYVKPKSQLILCKYPHDSQILQLRISSSVLFSWISVWLPEEFVEGRVFVALTVFLTLSAESSSAKETLPRFTMLQALTVIGLEHRSRQLKKIITEKSNEISAYKISILLSDSQLHHRNALRLDTFFKVMYPVIFFIFLFIYIFVVIEGDENKCIQNELNQQNNQKHKEL